MKATEKELATLEYLKDLIVAYEEIASIRMKRVKDRVLQNREFSEGMRDLYAQVRYLYRKELQRVKKGKQKTIRETNGKNVCVLLSANTGLYGDIISKVFSAFVEYVQQNDDDIVIVGNVGQRLLETFDPGSRDVKIFGLSDGVFSTADTQEMFSHITNYSKIVVFHGKFKDIINQEAAQSLITDDIFNMVSQETEEEGLIKTRYVFEPSLYGIMAYFETEMISSLLDHSLHESNLSKYSSRMISLDRAIERTNDAISSKKFEYQRSKHRIQNSKQVNRMAGMKFLGDI